MARVPRLWLDDVKRGDRLSDNAPGEWLHWVNKGVYIPLEAKATTKLRSRAEQLPADEHKMKVLRLVVSFFKKHPDREYAFERCAGELVRMMDSNVCEIELTRFWRDGGRDGIGKYRIGTRSTDILVDFALEAKCKEPSVNHSSGVRETTRLMSRLRYRQFGIFVTTSCIHEQAYGEIIEDGHPVLVIAGADICDILEKSGFNSVEAVEYWLKSNFSVLSS